MSQGKGSKDASQNFIGWAFETEANNEERYFLGPLQLKYGRSKLVRIFWIRPLERTT